MSSRRLVLDKQTIERVWEVLPKLREELYGMEWTLPMQERDGPRSLERVRSHYRHWEPWEIDRLVRFQEERNRQRLDKLRCQIENLKAEIIELEKLRRCGAKTRSGHPCQCYPLEGKRRCSKHGGKSTGCRTPEGRERLREAGRKTMALRLASRGFRGNDGRIAL